MNRNIGTAEGFYGDKFDQLIGSAQNVKNAGAFIPETVGVSQEIIDEALMMSGLPTINEAADLSDATLIEHKLRVPDTILGALVEAAEGLATSFNGPLLLRSSGRGDAVGIGVYDSRLHGSSPESITSAFVAVVGSYFTEQATQYRQRRGLDSGFGMFMQPVVGSQINTRDEWPHKREDFDTLDICERYECTLTAFGPIVSGNVKMGTARSSEGLLRLEEGIGSAVNKRGAPVLELRGSKYADNLLSTVNDAYIDDHIWFKIEDRVAGGNVAVLDDDGEWALSEADGRYGRILDDNEQIKLADFEQIITRLQKSLGKPCYLEFAVTNIEGQDKLYVLQLSTLEQSEPGNKSVDFEFVDLKDVLADRLQAQNDVVESEPFGKIVRLDQASSHSDLYAFDAQSAAEEGYLLVYSSRATHSGESRIDLRRLKNVRALLELESLDVGRVNGTAEEHLIGYSEQLGIPLLSAGYEASRARTKLFAINPKSGEREGDVADFGTLLVRNGRFRVTGDPRSGLSLVAKC